MNGESHAHELWDREALAELLSGRRLGHPLLVVEETESTNDLAWAEARAGAPAGLVVVAERQTRGRGRDGRLWFSPPGVGVWVSILLRPRFSARCLGLVPLASGVAAARAAESLGVIAGLKWPNDLVTADGTGRKLGGVLVESRQDEDGGGWTVVVGIGINVNTSADQFPAGLAGEAASLAMVAGTALSRPDCLVGLLDSLADACEDLAAGRADALLDAWRRRAVIFGRPVRARVRGGLVHGIARDVTEEGALVIRLDSGVELEVRAGELALDWETDGVRA